MSPTNLIWYNIFITGSTGLIGIMNLVESYRKYKGVKEVIYFAWAWFISALLWLSVSVGAIFYGQGLWQVDYFIFFYFVELFVALSPTGYALYVFYRIFGSRLITKIILAFYCLGSLLYYASIFKYGIEGPFGTFFGAEYTHSDISNIIFKIMFYPTVFFLVYLMVRQVISWLKAKKIHDLYKFIAGFSILLYACAGYFDEMGLYQDWHLFLVRLLLFVAMLVAYLSHHFKRLELHE